MAGMYPQIRSIVRSLYDTQQMRISAGQRVVAHFKQLIGQEPSVGEEELDAKGQKILADLRKENERITDGVALELLNKTKWSKAMKEIEKPLMTEYSIYRMLMHYEMMLSAETLQVGTLKLSLIGIPIYEQFLKDAPGIGPALAGIILSEIDIRVAKYATNIFSYCGVGVNSDGRGQSRRKSEMKDVEYIASDGTTKTRKSIGYNPWLKTKLVGVGGPSMLKAIRKEYYLHNEQISAKKYHSLSKTVKEKVEVVRIENRYSQVYRDMVHRYRNRPDLKESSDLHIHNMANRYMVKRFLADLYENWRALEGLTVHNPYEESKLGIVHTTKKKTIKKKKAA